MPGSLRHVATCLRSTKSFYQRLQQAINKAGLVAKYPPPSTTRCGKISIGAKLLTHGRWWSLPTSRFCVDPEVDIHLFVDASSQGLAVLDPAHRRYIQLQYDASEQKLIGQAIGTDGFNINVREQFGIALAAWIWGPKWRNAEPPLLHVRSWTDNTSAATRINNTYSSNRIAQKLNRAIGFAEITLAFRISAEHLPGACNIGADAGSRVWTTPHGKIWTNLTSSWTQDPVPQQIRYIYKTFSRNYKPDHFQKTATGRIQEPGRSGRSGASRKDSRHGWKAPATPSPVSWPHSLFPDGCHAITSPATLPAPCCPSSAKSLGIIADIGESLSDSMLDTNWLCKGCSGCRGVQHKKNRSPQKLLRRLHQHCNFNRPHDCVLWGAALMGYFFLLWRSEYLADIGRVKPYILRYTDVVCLTKDGNQAQVEEKASSVRVTFRGSKTDQSGLGETRILERSGLW